MKLVGDHWYSFFSAAVDSGSVSLFPLAIFAGILDARKLPGLKTQPLPRRETANLSRVSVDFNTSAGVPRNPEIKSANSRAATVPRRSSF